MNMGRVRSIIMSRFNISDHEACHISNKDSHFFCALHRLHATSPSSTANALFFTDIGPFYFRKTTYQVSLHVSALASCTMEDFDRSRLRRLSSVRMQVVAFVQSCHSYLPPFSFFVEFFLMCNLLQFYCQHMRSKALGLLAPALPANLPITESPARCACGLPLQHSDLESISPCEALAIRMSNQIDSSSGMVQASSYTAADKQHWEDINKELPPAPGDKKNTGQQRETPLTSSYLNIGELHRWVLLRGENLLDRSEPLQHVSK
jgi:hypothetical protein